VKDNFARRLHQNTVVTSLYRVVGSIVDLPGYVLKFLLCVPFVFILSPSAAIAKYSLG
jgi:hypothetical protein